MATVEFSSGLRRTLTIASGQTTSADVLSTSYKGSARNWSLMIFSPATLPESVKVQVAPTPTGTYCDLQAGGADITLAAGKALPLTETICGAIRLVAGSAVAADRAFIIQGKAE